MWNELLWGGLLLYVRCPLVYLTAADSLKKYPNIIIVVYTDYSCFFSELLTHSVSMSQYYKCSDKSYQNTSHQVTLKVAHMARPLSLSLSLSLSHLLHLLQLSQSCVRSVGRGCGYKRWKRYKYCLFSHTNCSFHVLGPQCVLTFTSHV